MNLQHTESLLNDLACKTQQRPVDQWNPPFCGHIDLIIKANGQWHYQGKAMTRQGLIDLFASVLWREDGEYFLKTPVEKIGIQVEDVPLFIDDVNLLERPEGCVIECITTHQDRVILHLDKHPLILREHQGQIQPYVPIRFGLEAKIMRHAFYHLLQWCQMEEQQDKIVLSVPMGDKHQTIAIPNDAF